MNTAAQPISGVNQKTYTRLKTSLRLNLRRQIFLAVCDDLELRSQLVSKLQAELAPHFVSLNLNLADPNPMAQVTQWLNQRSRQERPRSPATGFQILGIEHLTRQPAPVQKRFLTHLQAIEYYMPALECTMLLWVPRPWLRSICQSAPTFWEWHTALFEFEGDPTPLRPMREARSQPTGFAPARNSPVIRLPLAKIEPWTAPLNTPDEEAVELEETALLQTSEALPDALWEILTQDLSRLDGADLAPVESPAPAEASLLNVSSSEPQQPLDRDSLADRDSSAVAIASSLRQKLLAALEQDPNSEQHRAGLESLKQIEQLHRQHIAAETLATAYYSFGRAYRECIEQGDSSVQTLDITIAAHEQTLALLSDGSDMGADVANDLGNLYWMRSRNAIEADLQLSSLEQAIHAYQIALANTDTQAQPHTCAMIQNNLGSAYGDLAQYQEPAENLQKSVQAYEAALQYRSAEAEPARHAATQNNLGTTCWNLAQHQQPSVWLKRAIAAYQAALDYYTPETEPLNYAMLQNNMGTAYWNLAQHVQPGKNAATAITSSPEILLRLAIAAYENALLYRTVQASPAACAATQNNLGTAHWDLALLPSTSAPDRRERIRLTIVAYEAAIAAVEVLTQQTSHRPALTFDVFATHNNLGLAYYHLAMDRPVGMTAGDRQQALEKALNHHLRALQGWENRTEFQQSTLDFVVQTVRALFSEFGIQGQNVALSQIPPSFLPQVMTKL
ncbi:MAG: tetratricopeptide repeat protein [Leptolyngbyaceae cyanobacterium bins.302]|nr:tetratricopeptide repeat protein [Leptolyngbyaceae cyanobacterium bins.302]